MDLPQYLRWNPDGPHSSYQDSFRRKAEERFSAALAHLGESFPQVANAIVEMSDEIPATSVLRVAHSPELEYQSRAARGPEATNASLAGFLCDSLQAELLVLDQRNINPISAVLWTALGDYGFAIEPDEPNTTSKRSRKIEEARLRILKAPVIGDKVPVDFLSPHGRADVPIRFPECKPFSATEQILVVERLREAFAIIEVAGPELTRLVVSFTMVLLPLKVEDGGAAFGSFSSNWYPGRSVLINPQSPEMQMPDLVDALLHEAIHAVIDVSELANHLIVNASDPMPNVISPWTGASIALPGLLDAYFVWFGLFWFWVRAEERNAVAKNVCVERMEQCRRGFVPEFSSVVPGGAMPLVHPFARKMIEELRRMLLSAV